LEVVMMLRAVAIFPSVTTSPKVDQEMMDNMIPTILTSSSKKAMA
jgi:hypothetical protein